MSTTDNSAPPVTDNRESKPTDTVLQRVSLIVSTTTAVSTLLVGFSSDAVSIPWLLGSATVLCTTCLAFFFVATKPLVSVKAKRSFTLAATSCVMILLGAWLFAFRDDILFSRFLASFRHTPEVLVDDTIAHAIVTTKQGSARKERRLVSVVDSLVTEPHRTVIHVSSTPGPGKGLLRVRGLVNETRFSLTLEMRVPAQNTQGGVGANLSEPSDVLLSLGGDSRFLASSLDEGPLRVDIMGSPESLSDLLATSYRFANAVRLEREGSHTQENEFETLLQLCQVVTREQAAGAPWFPDAVLFAARHSVRKGDMAAASNFIEAGRRLFPDDVRLKVAEAQLKLSGGDLLKAEAAVASLTPSADETALVQTFRAVLALRKGDVATAIELLEAAATAEARAATGRRFILHTAIAVLSSKLEGNAEERGQRIVQHTEAASELARDVRLVALLNGFGWALRRNTDNAQAAFDRLRTQSTSPAEREACDYWRALGLAQMGEQDEAERLLIKLESQGQVGPAVLGLLSELLFFSSPDTQEVDQKNVQRAVQFARRAIEMQEKEVRSHRVLAFYNATEARRNTGDVKNSLQRAALAHLEHVTRDGVADAMSYELMSELYGDLANTVKAKESARKATELACSRERNSPACAVLDVRNLLAKKDASAAKARTKELIRWLNTAQGISRKRGNELLIETAIVWYEAQELDIAAKLYDIVRRNLAIAPASERNAMMPTVDCNEAFILVDQNRNAEAVKLFKGSLDLRPNVPDCEAGLAIALLQVEQTFEAVRMYRTAKTHDPGYSNPDVLRTRYFWSQTARDLAHRLSSLERTY